jgi:hypothetical protein
LAHLHLRIWSSFTNDKYDLVYKNQTIEDSNSKKKQKLKILDAIFDVSNEIKDIASDPDDIFNNF